MALSKKNEFSFFAAGEDEAKTLINVLIRPKIFELWNITRPEHEEAELICRATGRPPPEITFRYILNWRMEFRNFEISLTYPISNLHYL